MRPALLLLVLLAIASLPAPSHATAPFDVALLACDTLSVSPLQVRFEFGLANVGPTMDNFFLVPHDGSHILSCSITTPGGHCSTSAGGGANYVFPFSPSGSVQSLIFVSDHAAPCFGGCTENVVLDIICEGLCFSCTGIEATPTQPSTWGSVKAYYR